MKNKIVTSYYGFHAGPPFWGQLNRDRWYKYSIISLCNMGCDVVCYTDEEDKGYNQLSEIKEKFKLENLTIKIYKLIENPWQEKVKRIRYNNSDEYNNPSVMHHYTRSPQMYWVKFLLLQLEQQENINLFWIDCGLAHPGLMPSYASKYSLEEEYKSQYPNSGGYMENEWKYYYYDKAFNPESLQRISKFTNNKIINLYRNISDCNHSLFDENIKESVNYDHIYVIGGFFGGNSNLLPEYISECIKAIDNASINENYLFGDQEVMSYINAKNREWFSNWKFDTFYHEDWDNIYNSDMVSFSHFFLKDIN